MDNQEAKFGDRFVRMEKPLKQRQLMAL